MLEITHARTPAEVDALASQLQANGAGADIANYTFGHRTRLVNPMISYDAMAMALSFLPATGIPPGNETYTYHHLRRDLFDRVVATGVQLDSRYAVPSAHVTIARFITQDGFQYGSGPEEGSIDSRRVRELVEKIEGINDRLEQGWHGEWVVGQEKGLDFHKGQSWYGGGEAIVIGQGF